VSKGEILRRLRLGELHRLILSRYGPIIPDDDAGREDLEELLLPISLGLDGKRRMLNAIEVKAPWMATTEAQQIIDRINLTPEHLRKPTARKLGERLRIANDERERLKLKTIAPFDVTAKQLKILRKAKDRERKRRQRRSAGARSRTTYLAKSISRLKPWEAEGISRRTWYRQQKQRGTSPSAEQKGGGTSPSAINLTYYRGHTCATEQPESLTRKERAKKLIGEGGTNDQQYGRKRYWPRSCGYEGLEEHCAAFAKRQ
jgi:hypothetical protein